MIFFFETLSVSFLIYAAFFLFPNLHEKACKVFCESFDCKFFYSCNVFPSFKICKIFSKGYEIILHLARIYES